MRAIHTINASQMNKSSSLLDSGTGIGANFYGWDVFRSVYNGKVALYARVYYSWTGLAGGGNMICRVIALPTSAAATTETNYIWTHCSDSYATQFNNGATSPTLKVGGAASGSDWFDVCQMPYNSGPEGPLIPLPEYWSFRISNGGTGFSGGTLTIDKVVFFG